MQGKEAVEIVLAELQRVKATGSPTVTIESLESFLHSLAKQTEAQRTVNQAELALQLQYAEQCYQNEQSMFRTVIDSGQSAIKSSLLVGGGAAAALLAFSSAAWKSLKPEGIELLAVSILILALSVLCVVMAAGFNYLAQSSYHDGINKPGITPEDKKGNIFNVISCALIVISYVMYAAACIAVFFMLQEFSVIQSIPIG